MDINFAFEHSQQGERIISPMKFNSISPCENNKTELSRNKQKLLELQRSMVRKKS